MAQTSKLTEDEKKALLHELDLRIGSDITDLSKLYEVENEVVRKKDQLQGCVNAANYQVPSRLATTIQKAEKNCTQIDKLKARKSELDTKITQFLDETEPLRDGLDKKFADLNKLQEALAYLKTFQKLDDTSAQLKLCNDDEKAVKLYGQLKEMCLQYITGHRAEYFKEYTVYWHNVLRDKYTKQYEEVLNSLKWPFTLAQEYQPPPSEVLTKFNTLTRYLLLIEKPLDFNASKSVPENQEPCLPVRILLRPLKKRFAFHFTGSRQTARIDRPEWFLTQTLTWIKAHQPFLRKHVQPIADRLHMTHIKIETEFNIGLIELATERMHTILGIYHYQGTKGELIDFDAAFAHAIDEILGFHEELNKLTGRDVSSNVLSVLTKAETFVLWLAVEKKYALAKMDETLGNSNWLEPICAGMTSGLPTGGWVPRAAQWFITLLETIEERYSGLPQPGHRLQFLELQLELIEEWRVRLTQLMNYAVKMLLDDSYLDEDQSPDDLTAAINCAHHTRTVLLQWAHSLHYLQLHYYRSQFQQFTQQQHQDEQSADASLMVDTEDSVANETDDIISLNEVEERAQELAMNEIKRDSVTPHLVEFDWEPCDITADFGEVVKNADTKEESGVFGDAPALLAHLRDAGLHQLAEHMIMEFKACFRDYRKQKWHVMPVVEEMALSISSALCTPLSELCARLSSAASRLAPPLAASLRARLASSLDTLIFEDVALASWFNTGGTMQFTHDVKRNLVPAFMPPGTANNNIQQLPKLLESCHILNMDYEDARRLRSNLTKNPSTCTETLAAQNIRHMLPNEALEILNHRTDLNETSQPSVMELF